MKSKAYRNLGILAFAAVFMVSCGGARPKENALPPERAKLIDVLTLFVEAVQADRFDRAFGYLTAAEKAKMMEAGHQPSPEIRRRLKALRLSTLARNSSVRLRSGKVEGIFDQLPSLDPIPGKSREDGTGNIQGEEIPILQ